MSKSRIGSDPLDALFSSSEAEEIEKPQANPPTQVAKPASPKKAKKIRLTVLLDEEVADKLRDVVYWTPGGTVASIAQEAIEREIKRLEKKRGEEFPKRNGDIQMGRPVR